MMPPRSRDIFMKAIGLEGPARATFLDQACGDDAALRSEIEKLLAEDDRQQQRHQDAVTISPTGSGESSPGIEADSGSSGSDSEGLGASTYFDHECDNCEKIFEVRRGVDKIRCPHCGDMNRPTHRGGELKPGDRRGDFVILGTLGEGGMGKVYHAREVAHGDREVALKVISARLNTAQFMDRFREEQAILLRLSDHPWITKIHYVGRLDHGMPFINMEYVNGEDLLKHCNRRRLSIDERVQLFRNVCSAVDHAHGKKIIHRDLKPGNILVKLGPDGEAEPRIIDFGLAKALDQKFTEMTNTDPGTRMGTFEYAAPEQLGGRGDVGIATDIYALGVVLYELLSGTRPFEEPVDDEMNPNARRQELMQQVKDGEVLEPASRFGMLSIEEQMHRSTERCRRPESLLKVLRGDLVWIVLKCLETHPADRYGSLAELEADLQAFLDRRPVGARRSTPLYNAKRWIQRHGRPVAIGCVVLLAMVFLMQLVFDNHRLRQFVSVLEVLMPGSSSFGPDASQAERIQANEKLDAMEDADGIRLLSQPDVPLPVIAQLHRTAVILKRWEIAGEIGRIVNEKLDESNDLAFRRRFHTEQSDVLRNLQDWPGAYAQLEMAQAMEYKSAGESDEWITLELRRATYLDEDDDLSSDGFSIYESVWKRLQEDDPGPGHPERPTYSSEVSMCYASRIRKDDPQQAYKIMSRQFEEGTLDRIPDDGTINDARIFMTLLMEQERYEEAIGVGRRWLEWCQDLLPTGDSRTSHARERLEAAENALASMVDRIGSG